MDQSDNLEKQALEQIRNRVLPTADEVKSAIAQLANELASRYRADFDVKHLTVTHREGDDDVYSGGICLDTRTTVWSQFHTEIYIEKNDSDYPEEMVVQVIDLTPPHGKLSFVTFEVRSVWPKRIDVNEVMKNFPDEMFSRKKKAAMSRELRFASAEEALQHLADVTGRRIAVRVFTASEEFKKDAIAQIKSTVKRDVIHRARGNAIADFMRAPGEDMDVSAQTLLRNAHRDFATYVADVEDTVDSKSGANLDRLVRAISQRAQNNGVELGDPELPNVKLYLSWVALLKGYYDRDIKRIIESSTDQTMMHLDRYHGALGSPDKVEDVVSTIITNATDRLKGFREGAPSFMLYLAKTLDSQIPTAVKEMAEEMAIEDTGEGTDTPGWKGIERVRGYKNRDTGSAGKKLEQKVNEQIKQHTLYLNILGRGPQNVSRDSKEALRRHLTELRNDPSRARQYQEFVTKMRAHGWR